MRRAEFFVFLLCFLLVSCFSGKVLAQESLRGDNIRIRLLAPKVFSSEEETLVAFLFEPAPHWHVYWKNPGDSGAAPKFSIHSDSADIGPILWPTPVRLPVAHLTNLGYEGAAAYLFSVKPRGPHVEITADLEWLVCKEECFPGFGKVTLKRPARPGKSQWKSADFKTLQSFSDRLPRPGKEAPFQLHTEWAGDTLIVHLDPSDEQVFNDLEIFPVDGSWISPGVPVRDVKNRRFSMKSLPGAKARPQVGLVASLKERSWEFTDLPVRMPPVDSPADQSLWLLILFALAGGFILNLMPCVFPVISLKAFSLLNHQGERVRDSLLYVLGVLVTFSVLGMIFVSLQKAGSAIGWGFQLQSPLMILFLIVLFWVMALNFLGFFEFGQSVVNFAGQRSTRASSFGTGVLSVFVAAPCTGPFMGTALGAAAALPPLSAFTIFFFLGLGLSLPFLIFALWPGFFAILPRPGPWMDSLKQFFAFPLFATVLWLLWVLGEQTGTRGWFYGGACLLILSFALWLRLSRHLLFVFAAYLIAVAGVGGIGYRLSKTSEAKTVEWIPYSEEKLAEARAKGQAVFVDFTAAWCITCQVNKRVVLDTEGAEAVFRENDIFLMRGDWTSQDPKITKALNQLGRSSVPVYAFYPSDGSPVRLLPQILTLSMIEDLTDLSNKGGKQ